MSFLSGIVNFGKSALGFLKGNSIASTLAKTALLGLAVNKLSKSALKENNSGTQNIDKGVRLQIKPDANAKIPVLYGDAYFGGNITDAAMTNANKTMWYCLTLAEKTGTKLSDSSATNYTFNDVYWNQQRIVFQADGITADYAVDKSGTIDRSISGLVKIYLYAGGVAGGQAPQGYTASIPNATTVFPNWGASHTMQDLVFAIVSVDYNREKNVTGIGNMLFEVTSDMKKPGDVLYDYLKSNVYGAGIPVDEINTASIVALNTYSDETVAYNDEGTGAQTLPNRYQINGLIDTDEDVLKNAEQIASAAATWISYDTHEGTWGVIVNKAETSVASFSDDNILGNITVGGTGLQDLYNSVKVQFPHRDLRDSADYIKIEIPSGDRNANEPDNTLNLTYDNINEPVQAELLGFIELKQSRVDLVVTFETDFSYINLKAGDVIDLTNERYEFVSKPFRIITVTERQDSEGALTMEITALEYDADVYSVQSITRYTRSDDDGIITIGSIGKPNTPQVTKYEKAARPRIEIEAVSPSGVVEGLEYWITFDFNEADDELRSYSLIGTKRPVGGGIFNTGATVVFDYDNIGAQNFYVKVRGFNTTTVGQFSEPSGLVEFVPEQTTDAITPDTSVFDETGGLATALGVVSLLNNLDSLFGETPNSPGGLFDKIFSVFNEETGVDLVGQAAGGELVVAANISVQEEGTEVASQISAINFVGTDVTVTADGSVVTVTHTGTTGGGGDNGGGGTEPPVAEALIIKNKYPQDRTTYEPGVSATSPNLAPITGSYFLTWGFNTDFPVYGSLSLGTGNAKLYKSDGTLVQTLTAVSCSVAGNVLELPFSARDLKTDYYILLDAGFVTYCGFSSGGITGPTEWNFNTPISSTSPFSVSPDTNADFNVSVSAGDCAQTLTVNGSGIKTLAAGSGNILITDSQGATVQTLTPASFTYNGVGASATISGVTAGSSYTVTVPAGAFNGGDACAQPISSIAVSGSFTTPSDLELTSFETNSGRFEPIDNINVSYQSNIILNFNKTVTLGTGTIKIYSSTGALHQSIDVAGTFSSNKSSELIWVSGTKVYINPTVDMDTGGTYYILVDVGSVVADCSKTWGTSDTELIRFQIDPGPIIGSADPLGTTGPYGNTGVVNENGINLNTDRDVSPGPGNINVYDSNDVLVASLPANSSYLTYGA